MDRHWGRPPSSNAFKEGHTLDLWREVRDSGREGDWEAERKRGREGEREGGREGEGERGRREGEIMAK